MTLYRNHQGERSVIVFETQALNTPPKQGKFTVYTPSDTVYVTKIDTVLLSFKKFPSTVKLWINDELPYLVDIS